MIIVLYILLSAMMGRVNNIESNTTLSRLNTELKNRTSEIHELENRIVYIGPKGKWTKEDIDKYAPYYHGRASKFDPLLYVNNQFSQYIEPLKRRIKSLETTLQEKHVQTFQESENQAERARKFAQAIRKIFHVACPHPLHYRDENGDIDVKGFTKDLQIWVATITSVWKVQADSGHEAHCECCITFRRLATSYDDLCSAVLGHHEFTNKRVSIDTIMRWDNALSDENRASALRDLKAIGETISGLHSCDPADHSLDGATVGVTPVTSLSGEGKVIPELSDDSAQNEITRGIRSVGKECTEYWDAYPEEREAQDGQATTDISFEEDKVKIWIPLYQRFLEIRMNPRSRRILGVETTMQLYRVFASQMIKIIFWTEYRDISPTEYINRYRDRRKKLASTTIEYEKLDFSKSMLKNVKISD